MCQLIEKAASDAGISIEGANTIFTVFTRHLIGKVAELSQLINDVFADIYAELMQEQISSAASIIQEHEGDKYKSWHIPPQQFSIIRSSGKGELF